MSYAESTSALFNLQATVRCQVRSCDAHCCILHKSSSAKSGRVHAILYRWYALLYYYTILYCSTLSQNLEHQRSIICQTKWPDSTLDRLPKSFTTTLSQKMAPQSPSDTVLTAARLDNNLLDDRAQQSDTEC